MPLPIAAVLAFVSAVGGLAKAKRGSNQEKEAKLQAAALLKKRQPYQTPAELFKILQATEYNAQTGFDASTLQYLTTQTDRGFDAAIDTEKLLGGDPNDFSALFNDKIDAIMKIGAQDHALKTENFSRYLSANQMIAASKDAEWQSKENLLKDQLQAAQANRAAGAQEKANGTNMILSAAANYATSQLYSSWNKDAVSGTGTNFKPITFNNRPIAGLNYIPVDEQLPG